VDSLHYPSLRASHAALEPEQRRLSSLGRVLRLCALALAVEVTYAVLASPRFAVRTVELRGDAGVCAQIAAHLSRGPTGPRPFLQLPRNTNFFLAPTRQLARQVASFPAVRTAQVARDFPDRLVVTLERREPVAVVRTADQALLVDAQGVVYTIRNEWAWGLPELVAPHLTPEMVTGREAKAELASLLAVLRALGPNPQLGVTGVELDRGGEVTAVLGSGMQVRLGTPDQLPAKIRLLAVVLRQIGADRIASLDLSDPSGAYWRPRKPATRPAGKPEGARMVEAR